MREMARQAGDAVPLVPAALPVDAARGVVAFEAGAAAVRGRAGYAARGERDPEDRDCAGLEHLHILPTPRRAHGDPRPPGILCPLVYLLYSVLLAVAFAVSAPFYLWKGRGTGKYLRTLRERMGQAPPDMPPGGGPSIWIHAVSVGEVLAARVLVQPLKARLPGHRVFVSTTTLTGNAVARDAVRGADGVFFAPFDFKRPVNRVV